MQLQRPASGRTETNRTLVKLNNLRIGTRLGGGFGIVLALFALVVGVALWRLASLSSATHEMMTVPLAKERLVSEWFRSVASST